MWTVSPLLSSAGMALGKVARGRPAPESWGGLAVGGLVTTGWITARERGR
jgi:hypothetical protein